MMPFGLLLNISIVGGYIDLASLEIDSILRSEMLEAFEVTCWLRGFSCNEIDIHIIRLTNKG